MIDFLELQKSRVETENELKELLKKQQRVCVVRPCSWGKSYLIAKLCQEFSGKKIIVEPTNLLKDYLDRFNGFLDENVYVVTYQKLLHKTKYQLKQMCENIDYIFLDEVHRIGAEKWGDAIRVLTDTFFNAKVIGMSATPVRSDGNDIVDSFFNGIQVKPMYLGDAIKRGILPNVHYVSALYTITEEYSNTLERINKLKDVGQEIKSLMVTELDDALLKYNELYNIPNILQKNLFKNIKHLHNMKLVLFCNRISEIDYVKSLAAQWFSECYEKTGVIKDIRLYDVHCRKGKRKNSLEIKSFEEPHADNVIDLLVSVNMFNEGLHLNNVNGVILLRKTKSNIVYFQQIGRAISQDMENPIVFDFVNNCDSVEDGYISLFIDSNWKYNKEKGNIYNTQTNNILSLRNGEIINIHDETRNFVNIVDNITKNKGLNFYFKVLDNEKQWIVSNKNSITIADVYAKTGIPVKIIWKYLSENNINLLDMQDSDKNKLSENQQKYVLKLILTCNYQHIATRLHKDSKVIKEFLDLKRIELLKDNCDSISNIDDLVKICFFNSRTQLYNFIRTNHIQLQSLQRIEYRKKMKKSYKALSLDDVEYIKEHINVESIEYIAKKIKKRVFVVAKYCRDNYLKYKADKRENKRADFSKYGYPELLSKVRSIKGYENLSLDEIGEILKEPVKSSHNKLYRLASYGMFKFKRTDELTKSDKEIIESNLYRKTEDIANVIEKPYNKVFDYLTFAKKEFIKNNPKLTPIEIALYFGIQLNSLLSWCQKNNVKI